MTTHLKTKHLRKGLTLTEVLIALVVSLTIVASVAAAFIQVVRSSDEAQAQARANTSGRLAVDVIARDLKLLQEDIEPEFHYLQLIDRPLTYGDRIDNTNDGQVDAEFFNGRDDLGVWQATDDRHAVLGPGVQERFRYLNVADFGDETIDRDVRFSADEIQFIIPADQQFLGSPRRHVTYRIGDFEGEENVLLRITRNNPADAVGPFPDEIVEPIVFDVVSLDILAWNPNTDANGPVAGAAYWSESWDSNAKVPPIRPVNSPAGTPPFRFPSAFLVSVVVNAERVPLSEFGGPAGNGALRTVRSTTVVNVEAVMSDIRYSTFVREP